MGRDTKPDAFWAINSHKYDTYMVSNTDRISFKCKELYRFMEDYAKEQINNYMGGLAKICKMYGSVEVSCDGKKVIWLWDYKNDEPRLKSEMSKEEIEANEKLKINPLQKDK